MRVRSFVMGAAAVVALTVGSAQAQTPGTYADRARLATAGEFIQRVGVAAVVGAITVALEDEATADHAVRARLAGYALREPEAVARRLAAVLAATATVEVSAEGVPSTPLTDAQIQAVIAQRWTVLARALVVTAP